MGRTSSVMKMLHRKNEKKARAKIKAAILEGKKNKRSGGSKKTVSAPSADKSATK